MQIEDCCRRHACESFAGLKFQSSGRVGTISCILLLDDGRALHRSNLGYSVMLELVSREVSDAHANLGVWLADMADRTSPFCEFDLRGLTVEHRAEFWAAAGRAL